MFPRFIQSRVLSIKSLSRRTTATSCSSSSGNKIHELRRYKITPAKMSTFLQLMDEYFHLRTAHSKLFGGWTAELGAINEAISIWEYDSLVHRSNVRQALARDTQWMSTFMSNALPLIVEQTNTIISALPWIPINLEISSKPRVFELVCNTLLPGKLPQWEHQLQQGWYERISHSQPIGIWKSIFGSTHQVYELWAYESFDEKIAVDEKLANDVVWRDIVSHLILLTKSSWNIGLVPISLSPIK